MDTRTPDAPVLRAEGLAKSYEGWAALEELSFQLHAGRVLGFLGPNGAGKTTSIRILTTILAPSSGRFEIGGLGSERPAKIRPLIGVLPETLGLPNQITGIEYMTYFGQLYGRRRAEARTHGAALLELVGLRDRARKLIRTYSHGMRQRLGIARALVNDPLVLFLDEPIVGLDPRGQQDLLSLLRVIATERGAGIIFCSHGLAEVEGACDDVVILSSGRVVASGSVAEVMEQARRTSPGRTGLRLQVPTDAVRRATEALNAMPHVESVAGSIVEGQLEVTMSTAPNTAPNTAPGVDAEFNPIIENLIRSDIPVLSFEVEGSRLQDAFMQLTEEGVR